MKGQLIENPEKYNPLFVLDYEDNLLPMEVVRRKQMELDCTCDGDDFLGDIYRFDPYCPYHNWIDEHHETITDQSFWKSVMG